MMKIQSLPSRNLGSIEADRQLGVQCTECSQRKEQGMTDHGVGALAQRTGQRRTLGGTLDGTAKVSASKKYDRSLQNCVVLICGLKFRVDEGNCKRQE